MFYCTYVLYSLKDHKFYIDHTNDLKSRLKEHERGHVLTTKLRRPFKLVYFEVCLDKHDAIKRERYFKTGFGRRFLKSRLTNFLKGRK